MYNITQKHTSSKLNIFQESLWSFLHRGGQGAASQPPHHVLFCWGTASPLLTCIPGDVPTVQKHHWPYFSPGLWKDPHGWQEKEETGRDGNRLIQAKQENSRCLSDVEKTKGWNFIQRKCFWLWKHPAQERCKPGLFEHGKTWPKNLAAKIILTIILTVRQKVETSEEELTGTWGKGPVILCGWKELIT